MKPDINEIAESIRKDWESRKVEVPPKMSYSFQPPSSSISKDMKFNTMIQWKIPIELCPTCLCKLKGREPEYIKGWTNNAKESWGKKKKPPKAPKIAEDTGIKGVVEV